MAPDRTILHLVEKKIQVGGLGQTQIHSLSKIMACTLLSLSYAPGHAIYCACISIPRTTRRHPYMWGS